MRTYAATLTVSKPAFLGGGQWILSGLTPITVLLGKNGSGKSQLLRQLHALDVESHHYVVPERGGSLDYQAQFLLRQTDGNGRRQSAQQNFVGEYRQHIIARVQTYFQVRGSIREGQLPGDPAKLENFLSSLLPDFSVELNGNLNPPIRIFRIEDNSQVTNVEQLSSGEAQILPLAVDVLTIAAIWEIQNKPRRILFVDEPDAHIHPDLQARFADFLVRVANHFDLQIVVATHSTTLLSAIGQFAANEASVIYLNRNKSEFTAIPFTETLRELSACLGGHALMGPLFGMPLLLVEGDDDYRIWSQVPRHHQVSFSVIPCGGDQIKQYQEALEKVFSCLRDSSQGLAGYALLDGDKSLPQPSKENPQAHVRFIRLACHEAENLYLTDKVLAVLGTDWQTAAAKIVIEAPKYGQKQSFLATAPQWDRKTADVKDVINQIVQILDPKNVHWTVRVGVALGRERPQGELGDFLGQDTIIALWGSVATPPAALPN